MRSNRRIFIKMTGISILGSSILSATNVFASNKQNSELPIHNYKKNKKSLEAKQWAMIINTKRINSLKDIEPIINACNKVHNIPVALKNENHIIKWIWYEKFHNAFPDKFNKFTSDELEHKFFPILCNHCENPPCVRACPTKATFKRKDGIVLMDFHRCIGCRFCMAACPFGARSFNFRDPRPFISEQNKKFPTRTKGVVEKCNFCAERLAIGEIPACVEVSNDILTFGDLQNPNSKVRNLLRTNYTIRRKQNLGTEPSVYYIV